MSTGPRKSTELDASGDIDDMATSVGSSALSEAIAAARDDQDRDDQDRDDQSHGTTDPAPDDPDDWAGSLRWADDATDLDDASTVVGSAALHDAISAARRTGTLPPPQPSLDDVATVGGVGGLDQAIMAVGPDDPDTGSDTDDPDTGSESDDADGDADVPTGSDPVRWTPPPRLTGRVVIADDVVFDRPKQRDLRPIAIGAVAVIVVLVAIIVVLSTRSGDNPPVPDSVPGSVLDSGPDSGLDSVPAADGTVAP